MERQAALKGRAGPARPPALLPAGGPEEPWPHVDNHSAAAAIPTKGPAQTQKNSRPRPCDPVLPTSLSTGSTAAAGSGLQALLPWVSSARGDQNPAVPTHTNPTQLHGNHLLLRQPRGTQAPYKAKFCKTGSFLKMIMRTRAMLSCFSRV